MVGLIPPAGLALGAATGPAVALSNASATGCAGARRPTVGPPALTSGDSGQSGARGRTSVKGPGQNRIAKRSARSFQTTSARAGARLSMWTISGLKRGRPLAAKIAATAASLVATPPSP